MILGTVFLRYHKRWHLATDFYVKLGRWKCTLCKRTFIVYPKFGLPYKRYLLPDIIELTDKYLEEDRQTYRWLAEKRTNLVQINVSCMHEKVSKTEIIFGMLKKAWRQACRKE